MTTGQRLDMERIVGWLAESYWARARTEAQVRRSWDAAGGGARPLPRR